MRRNCHIMRGSTANRERWIAFFICFALHFYILFLLFLFVSDKMAKNDQMSLPTLEILKKRQKMENKILKWYLCMLIRAHISFTSVHWFLFLIQTIKLIVCVGFIEKKNYTTECDELILTFLLLFSAKW